MLKAISLAILILLLTARWAVCDSCVPFICSDDTDCNGRCTCARNYDRDVGFCASSTP